MSIRIFDPWTGKPVDKASDLLPRGTGERHECGAEIITNCPRCGAPNCCPKCCEESEREQAALRAAKEPQG